jgi:tight adherence protein C
MTPAALLAGAAGASAAAGLVELATLARERPRRPRSRRVLVTAVARVGARLGVRASGGLAGRVAAAGLDVPVADVVAVQAGLALLAGLAVLPLVPGAPGRLGPLLLAAGPLAGFLAPEAWLRRRARARRRAIEAELPDVLDLLRVAVAAGLAPRRALAEVGRRHPGLLARELRRAAGRAGLGEPVASVLDGLKARCPAPGVGALVAALQRAERHGAPLAATLAAQAAEARSRRASQRSETAARAAPKIQLVVALLLVPAVLMLVAAALAPALMGH